MIYWVGENINVAFYEELCADPRSVLQAICRFSELDPAFYSDYEFKVFNRSETMKNSTVHGAYGQFRTRIRKYTHNLPIHIFLRRMRRWFDSNIYYRLNTRPSESVEISPLTRSKLESYYKQEIQALEALLDRSVPW